MEGLFAAGCAFPHETTRSEKERVERSIATHGASKSIDMDGARTDGSAEDRRCFFYHFLGIPST